MLSPSLPLPEPRPELKPKKLGLRIVTQSELRTYRRCPREHHLSYVEGYRATSDSQPLRLGTAIHLGLEAWWLGQPLSEALKAATAGLEDPYEAAKVRAMLVGYDARWEADRPLYEVVQVEAQFQAPILNPETGHPSKTFQLAGKIDVLTRTSVVEHKTTSQDIGYGSPYWRKLTLDSQISTYYQGARALGVSPDKCVYDVLRKPLQKPSSVPLLDQDGLKVVLDGEGNRVLTAQGKPRQTADQKLGYVLQSREETPEEYEARLLSLIAEAPDKYYQRGEIVRLESEELDHQLDTWQLTRSMREAQLAKRAPRNADACERFGSLCPFFDVCTGTASLDDPGRFEKKPSPHAELTLP